MVLCITGDRNTSWWKKAKDPSHSDQTSDTPKGKIGSDLRSLRSSWSSVGVDHELMPFFWCVFPGLFTLQQYKKWKIQPLD